VGADVLLVPDSRGERLIHREAAWPQWPT
jgi:hypothetical protein